MISVAGMPTILALKLVDSTEAKQEELIRSQGEHARAIEYFKENIGNIETVDQLIEDDQLYGFVMRAYDLEDQIFGKAMMEKILKSNIEEDDALVNKLTDTRFKEIYNGLGFGTDGEGNTNTVSTTWQDEMVERYVDRQFVNAQSEDNGTLGTILEVRRKLDEIEKPLDILKNEELTEFFQVALGLPTQLSGLDIDRQVGILEQKLDFEDLQDPEEVNRLIVRYAAIKDATEGVSQVETGATILMQSAVDTSTNLLSAVLDISTIRNVNTTYWSR